MNIHVTSSACLALRAGVPTLASLTWFRSGVATPGMFFFFAVGGCAPNGCVVLSSLADFDCVFCCGSSWNRTCSLLRDGWPRWFQCDGVGVFGDGKKTPMRQGSTCEVCASPHNERVDGDGGAHQCERSVIRSCCHVSVCGVPALEECVR